uniref:Uncharacterized protein n=1 Tax=Anguilla anguilla TaxID=7936 RepID=A0A0E9RP87_ANGAN
MNTNTSPYDALLNLFPAVLPPTIPGWDHDDREFQVRTVIPLIH